MDEYITVYQVGIAGVGMVISGFLYSLGGRAGKWFRRFIASFVIAATLNGLCAWRGIWSPWLLVVWPMLIGGFSLGYGAEQLGPKIIKRSIVVFACCSACVLCSVILGNYWLLIPAIGVAAFSVFLGVKNPIEAAAEEFFVCLLLTMALFMYPFLS